MAYLMVKKLYLNIAATFMEDKKKEKTLRRSGLDINRGSPATVKKKNLQSLGRESCALYAE
jgi:hypothetical protein